MNLRRLCVALTICLSIQRGTKKLQSYKVALLQSYFVAFRNQFGNKSEKLFKFGFYTYFLENFNDINKIAL